MKSPLPAVPKEQLARCLSYLQSIVPSLEELDAEATCPTYADDLARFVEAWGVTPKLKEVRSLLLLLANEDQLQSLQEPAVWHRDAAAHAQPRRRRRR